MGQAERVLAEWTRRRIEALERTLSPGRLDQVNEAERARTEGTGGIPPPQGKYERQLFWARRSMDHLEMGGEIGHLMRVTDEWAQHHGHDLTIQQGPPEGGATIILFCRTCDNRVGGLRGAGEPVIGAKYAEHLGHDIRIRRDECPEEPDLVFYGSDGRPWLDEGSTLPWLVEHLPNGSTFPALKPGTNRIPIPGLDVGIDCHTCENYEGGPTPLFSGRVSDWFDELWNN